MIRMLCKCFEVFVRLELAQLDKIEGVWCRAEIYSDLN